MRRWTVFDLAKSSTCENCSAPFLQASFVKGPASGPPEKHANESLMVCAVCGALYSFEQRGELKRLSKIPDDASEETRRVIHEIRTAVLFVSQRRN